MKDECRLSGVMRGVSPCKDCGERFTACWGKCPKDARGEYGYDAWKADAKKVNDTRRTYAIERHKTYEDDKRRKKWERTHT